MVRKLVEDINLDLRAYFNFLAGVSTEIKGEPFYDGKSVIRPGSFGYWFQSDGNEVRPFCYDYTIDLIGVIRKNYIRDSFTSIVLVYDHNGDLDDGILIDPQTLNVDFEKNDVEIIKSEEESKYNLLINSKQVACSSLTTEPDLMKKLNFDKYGFVKASYGFEAVTISAVLNIGDFIMQYKRELIGAVKKRYASEFYKALVTCKGEFKPTVKEEFQFNPFESFGVRFEVRLQNKCIRDSFNIRSC